MLLKHYLEQGVSKTELPRRFGVSRGTIHYWLRTGQLDRYLSAGARGYASRSPVAHKLDPYRGNHRRAPRSETGFFNSPALHLDKAAKLYDKRRPPHTGMENS